MGKYSHFATDDSELEELTAQLTSQETENRTFDVDTFGKRSILRLKPLERKLLVRFLLLQQFKYHLNTIL